MSEDSRRTGQAFTIRSHVPDELPAGAASDYARLAARILARMNDEESVLAEAA